MNNPYIWFMIAGTFFGAVSQLLLKQSAGKKYKNILGEYLNWRVMTAYAIYFGVLILNTYCFTRVQMKLGPVIDCFTYAFILLLSRLVLKEKSTKGKLLGNLVILIGILIYTL